MSRFNGRIERALSLTQTLAESLTEPQLALGIPALPSNKIGEQLWCMVGARESYLNAIKNNQWMGFKCSLQDRFSKGAVLEALNESQQALMEFINQHSLNNTQIELLLDLHEHELQHHGQLIRFLYANKIPFPPSWHERYTV